MRRAHPLAAAVLGGLCLLPLLWPQGAVQGATGIAPLPAHQPRRVVSINLCTDQLAMMMAGPGQLVSVSHLAGDPTYSTMPEAAAAYPANRGLAEEVYLLKPDLVLAGAYSDFATVEMLRRLGIRVEVFPPAASLDEVRAGIAAMGQALGQGARAREMLDGFDQRRAALPDHPGPRPTAATYAADGYVSGARSLAGEIVTAAGFRHLAADLGMEQGGFVPLEALVMARPDLVILGEDIEGAARAEEVLHHPALQKVAGDRGRIEDRDWICGLPSVLDAVERLARLHDPAGTP